jgi:hypothetical protein
MPSEVQAFLSGLATVGPVGLALILITGAMGMWDYGRIGKAKDAEVERLTALLEKATENNRTLLGIMESAKRGQR